MASFIDNYLIPKNVMVKIKGVKVTKKGQILPICRAKRKLGIYSGDRMDDVVGFIMQETKADFLWSYHRDANNDVPKWLVNMDAKGIQLMAGMYYSIRQLRTGGFSYHLSCLK